MKKFTMIELMMVIGILVILIGIGMSAANNAMRASAQAQIRSEIHMIESACRAYKTDYEVFPISTDPDIITFAEMIMDIEVESENGRFIDPFGDQYRYTDEGHKIIIYSSNQD